MFLLEIIGDFRPISLINTDLKILSHIIAERTKPTLNYIIGQHQTAHLANRNIHKAIMKIQSYAMEMSKEESILALDFSKAFDCVDMKYLLKLVDRIPFSNLVKQFIQRLYQKNIAFIGFASMISEPFTITRGVRQIALCQHFYITL